MAPLGVSLYTYLGLSYRTSEETEAFAQALARGDRAGAMASLSDRLLDEVCLMGPASRCQERLAACRAAGVQYPILAAQAVNEDYANAVRRILKAFGDR
jgi:hypothetical protein